MNSISTKFRELLLLSGISNAFSFIGPYLYPILFIKGLTANEIGKVQLASLIISTIFLFLSSTKAKISKLNVTILNSTLLVIGTLCYALDMPINELSFLFLFTLYQIGKNDVFVTLSQRIEIEISEHNLARAIRYGYIVNNGGVAVSGIFAILAHNSIQMISIFLFLDLASTLVLYWRAKVEPSVVGIDNLIIADSHDVISVDETRSALSLNALRAYFPVLCGATILNSVFYTSTSFVSATFVGRVESPVMQQGLVQLSDGLFSACFGLLSYHFVGKIFATDLQKIIVISGCAAVISITPFMSTSALIVLLMCLISFFESILAPYLATSVIEACKHSRLRNTHSARIRVLFSRASVAIGPLFALIASSLSVATTSFLFGAICLFAGILLVRTFGNLKERT